MGTKRMRTRRSEDALTLWGSKGNRLTQDCTGHRLTQECAGNRLIEEPTEWGMHSLCSFSWWEKYLAVRVLCWDNFLVDDEQNAYGFEGN